MALPQDGQNANALATVKEVPTGKKLIFVDPTTNEGGIITLEDLTTQILKKLTSQTFALDQGTKTLPAALNELNSNRISSYASAAFDKIPDGNEIAFFRAGENAIVVNENLTIPPWAFCIYIPFKRDAGLIVIGIGKVIAAYRMNGTWTYRYDIK